MIYYCCPDHPIPSGGVKTLYRHVEILNAAGIEATILHAQAGFRCHWFESSAPTVGGPIALSQKEDWLVFPEILGPHWNKVPGFRKVIFNQNVFYTFRDYPVDWAGDTPYQSPEVLATMVLTHYDQRAFQWAFPQHRVEVIRHGIDPVRFPLGTAKKRQIAFMPRKHPDESVQTFGWLRARNALNGWTIKAIHGLSEAETSAIMQESLIFLAFGYPEGGTLPPFEAAATGCVVLGYGGFASSADLELLGGWVGGLLGERRAPEGNSLQLAKIVEPWLSRSQVELEMAGKMARESVLLNFAMEDEAKALVAFWRSLL